MKNVGKELKRIRKKCQITQAQLADRTKVAQANISRYESGAVVPTFETAQVLFGAMDHQIVVTPCG